jgi:hypothetical protein
VIEPIKEMYFAGLLASVRFIGERKGTFSVLIDSETAAWDEKTRRNYHAAVNRISQSLDDPWPVNVDPVFGLRRESSIVHGEPEEIATYLKNIQLLWKLRRPAGASNIFRIREASGSILRRSRSHTSRRGFCGTLPF